MGVVEFVLLMPLSESAVSFLRSVKLDFFFSAGVSHCLRSFSFTHSAVRMLRGRFGCVTTRQHTTYSSNVYLFLYSTSAVAPADFPSPQKGPSIGCVPEK